MGCGWVVLKSVSIKQKHVPHPSLLLKTHDVAICESGSDRWKHVHDAGPVSVAQSPSEMSAGGGGRATMMWLGGVWSVSCLRGGFLL